MALRKRSTFFEKLTGAINADDNYDAFEDETEVTIDRKSRQARHQSEPAHEHLVGGEHAQITIDTDDEPAELTVDVYHDDVAIILQTIVAGTDPKDLDVDITRDMVTIKGARHNEHDANHTDFLYKELYWGPFSRNIALPEEIDVEEANATIKNGLLTIHLPKIDTGRKTKLKVRVV